MMIYLCGDTHGLNDLGKLTRYFKDGTDRDGHTVTKSDNLVILGDVACCWDGKAHDKKVRKALHDLPPTVLWLDGNHENFDLIECLPIADWHGGKVQYVIKDDIIHLMRGQIYNIEGKTFFTFGGGNSIDRIWRTPGLSWWPQEMPSMEEYDEGIRSLKMADYKVDYILSHTCPRSIAGKLVLYLQSGEEELQRYFEDITDEVQFNDWYFGHWHMDMDIGKFHALYDNVVKLEE